MEPEPFVRPLHQFLIAAAVLIIFQLIFSRSSDRVSRAVWNFLSRISRHPAACALAVFLLVIATRLALLPLLHIPVPGIHDEFSYLLMGDTFAHGRLSNPPHPMWMSFETFHVNWHPRYASMYPPAQGFVLAIGELLGHPWIGVLLSSAAMCAVIYWMLLAWIRSRWALLGGLIAWLKFGAVSYWMNSYWGGAVAAIGGALLLGALARILRRPRARDAFLFALGLAILANSRPYEGLLFSVPAVVVLMRWLFQKTRVSTSAPQRWRVVMLPIAVVLLFTCAFMAYYNAQLTGNVLLFPHTLNVRTYHTAAMFLFQTSLPEKHYNNQQFEDFYNGWEREEFDHTWKSVKELCHLKSRRFFAAFGWDGILLILPALYFTVRERRLRVPWLALILVSVGSYLVVWSNAHYAAPVAGILILLYLQTLRHLRLMHWRNYRWGAILARTSVLLLLVDTVSAAAQKECDRVYWTCQGDISRLTVQRRLEAAPGKHLVMVRYGDDHNIHDDWAYNGAEIDSAKVIWAREINPQQDAKLFSYFRDRTVWLVTPDTDNTYLAPYTPPGNLENADQ